MGGKHRASKLETRVEYMHAVQSILQVSQYIPSSSHCGGYMQIFRVNHLETCLLRRISNRLRFYHQVQVAIGTSSSNGEVFGTFNNQSELAQFHVAGSTVCNGYDTDGSPAHCLPVINCKYSTWRTITIQGLPKCEDLRKGNVYPGSQKGG